MKLAYDIEDMTITQFIQFCLLFVIFVPIQLVLFLFMWIGSIYSQCVDSIFQAIVDRFTMK